MKILFVENRHMTWVWAAVAERLAERGHKIHWLVQNPIFCPKIGQVHMLPFPTRKEKQQDASLEWLRDLDRGVRWFGGDGTHWHCYNQNILRTLQEIRPDVIFGEPTEFHELLTLENARTLGIRFLFPSSTRYPVGRLHFLDYDTLYPVGGAGHELTDSEAEVMLNAIVHRTVIPTYMEVSQQSRLKKEWDSLVDKTRILTGWLRGEHYVTPSPWKKIRLNRAHTEQYALWESFAHRILPDAINDKPWVLFPLQMQPEANIEVWGKPWSDQTALVKRAAAALDRMGAVLVVKPNPKSKYELTSELCELAKTTPNIVAISHYTPMKVVFPQAPLVMTVTGTVLLECVFAGKPVASLGNHAMTHYPGVQALSEPENIAQTLENVIKKTTFGATKEEAKRLLNFLYQTSYPVQIFASIAHTDLMDLMTEKNIATLVDSFESVLTHTISPLKENVPGVI
jgi:hypothetical protein